MPRIIELKEIDEIALGHINTSRAKHEMPPFKDVMQANHCEMLWGLRNAVKESLLKRESGWLPIETLPDKLNNDIFVAYFISRGDCCWVQLKRTVEQIHKMMVQPTHWMYVPEVATTEIEDGEPT